ncbi:MAG TPA: CPBP family intramembrane glutamic endopeptidase [Candidatus Sulfotelmatobacter sp.]|nr:CPBP family intramembrane glutamic endopeptidase [Candidatus Sulfotelmatobacter sp.]
MVALAIALAVPHLFSDPNGLDPYILRLTGVTLTLAVAALLMPALVDTRAVLLSIAATTTSFSLFTALPRLLVDVLGEHAPSGPAQLLWASLAQVVVTLCFAGVILAAVPAPLRPELRLSSFPPGAILAALTGMAVLMLLGLALPAPLLGREGFAPQALARDLPWLAPACTLQAFAQELQFRGFLMGAFERVAPARAANLAQAILFGLAHLAIQYPGPVGPFIPVTVVLGLLFGWLVQRFHSLWPAVAIHAAGDIAITSSVLSGLYGL